MEAIVLAGGFGTRLKAVVFDLPKPMAPVAGKPFLEILLKSLAQKGFTRVVLALGYMAEKVRLALKQCLTDHVFVFNGDTYLDLEVAHVEAHWQMNHMPIIVARDVLDTARYGRLETVDGGVVGFSEKGVVGRGLINAGCYVLPTDILNSFELGQPFSLETDFLAQTIKTQRFDVVVTEGHFIDIGVPEDYARAQTELAGVFN